MRQTAKAGSFRAFLICTGLSASVVCLLSVTGEVAQAQIFPFKDAVSSEWLKDVSVKGLIEGGIMANPARPSDGMNYGNFFADHANQMQLNQLNLTVSKAVDQSRNDYQIGFVLEALYGSDARYYHLLGVSGRMTSLRYQLIPAQAHVDVHLPWLTKNGLDMEAGILQSPMGVEGLDPSSRPFYTLAYTSQYSVPFEHVGALFHWHAAPKIDVNFGIDTGNQTTFGKSDDNDEPAGYFGVTFHDLLNGKLKITELSRVGPEDQIRVFGRRAANAKERFWNDLSGTYQINERLSVTGEFNYLHDAGLRADTYSFISFLQYQILPELNFNFRGEIYRDNTGLFVATFLRNQGAVDAIAGINTPTLSAPPTTYGEMTLGLTWHPDIGHGVRVFEIRPEIRFDRSLNGTTPFNGSRNSGMFTFGGDAMIGF